MNILITGACGFIGFHLSQKLLKKNKIYGIDNLNNYYDPQLKKSRLKILTNQKMPFSKIDLANNEKINELNLNPRRSIIINRIKLNLTLNDSGELFDLNNDPYEEINLIDSPEYQKTIKAMKQRLIEWQIKTEDYFRFD